MNILFVSVLIVFHSLFISSKYVIDAPASMHEVVSYIIYAFSMAVYFLSFFQFKKINRIFSGYYVLLFLYVSAYLYLALNRSYYVFSSAAVFVLIALIGVIYTQFASPKIPLPSKGLQKANLFFWILSTLAVSFLAIAGIRDGMNQLSVSFFATYAAAVVCVPFMGKFRLYLVVFQILILLRFCYIYFPDIESFKEIEVVHYVMGGTTFILILTLLSFVIAVCRRLSFCKPLSFDQKQSDPRT